MTDPTADAIAAWFIRPRGRSVWTLTADEAEVARCRATGGDVDPLYGQPKSTVPAPDTLQALRNARLFVLEEYSRRVECHDHVTEEAFIAEAGELTDELDAAIEALLSAQGQAGKPVAWLVTYPDPEELVVCLSEARALEYADGDRSDVHPLYVQPQPAAGAADAYPTEDAYLAACRALEKHRKRTDDAEAKLTTARTALEAAEELLARAGFGASDAYAEVAAALATIKGLET